MTTFYKITLRFCTTQSYWKRIFIPYVKCKDRYCTSFLSTWV